MTLRRLLQAELQSGDPAGVGNHSAATASSGPQAMPPGSAGVPGGPRAASDVSFALIIVSILAVASAFCIASVFAYRKVRRIVAAMHEAPSLWHDNELSNSNEICPSRKSLAGKHLDDCTADAKPAASEEDVARHPFGPHKLHFHHRNLVYEPHSPQKADADAASPADLSTRSLDTSVSPGLFCTLAEWRSSEEGSDDSRCSQEKSSDGGGHVIEVRRTSLCDADSDDDSDDDHSDEFHVVPPNHRLCEEYAARGGGVPCGTGGGERLCTVLAPPDGQINTEPDLRNDTPSKGPTPSL